MAFGKNNLVNRVNNRNFGQFLSSKLIDDASYARLDFQDNCSKYIASGNFLLGNCFNLFLFKKIYLPIICCVLFTIVFCLTVNKFFVGLAYLSMILLVSITVIIFIRKVVFYFIKPKMLLKMIKGTDCYKGIIEKIKSSDLDRVVYIYSNKCKVVLCDCNGNKINIAFNKFNFPNLSIDKQPLLIAGIIDDLYKDDKCFYKISNKVKEAGLGLFDCDNECYKYRKNDYNFENLFVAVNSKYFVRNNEG